MKVKKFDVIVGNPPYQGENNVAIYHRFMNVAKIFSRFVSLVYPSRWMFRGRAEGLKEFKEIEGNSLKYVNFYDFSSSLSIFPSPTRIRGGVNFFLWDKLKNSAKLKYFYNDVLDERKTIGDYDFIRSLEDYNIVSKVNTVRSLSEIVGKRGFYGEIVSNYSKMKKLEKANTGIFGFAIELSSGASSGVRKIEIDYNVDNVKSKQFVNKENSVNISDFAVAVSKTTNILVGDTFGRPNRIFIKFPNEILSESFLKVGSFDNEAEAVNCLRFLKTDFVGFLFGLVTPTQNSTRDNYKLIPLVDFKTGEIIDKPGCFLDFNNFETLDEQLFNFYNFDVFEIDLIRKDLKKWKNKFSVDSDF